MSRRHWLSTSSKHDILPRLRKTFVQCPPNSKSMERDRLLRNCFGRGSKPRMTASVNTTAKESETHSQKPKNPSKFEDYWSSSTFDMDNNTFQSQGSISSISTSTVDPQGVANSPGAHMEFINHGLILWNQTRQRWIGNKKWKNLVQQHREPKLNWNVTYESLLGSDKPFPHPIPLSEMVDFLVDTWEQEGLYD